MGSTCVALVAIISLMFGIRGEEMAKRHFLRLQKSLRWLPGRSRQQTGVLRSCGDTLWSIMMVSYMFGWVKFLQPFNHSFQGGNKVPPYQYAYSKEMYGFDIGTRDTGQSTDSLFSFWDLDEWRPTHWCRRESCRERNARSCCRSRGTQRRCHDNPWGSEVTWMSLRGLTFV